MDQNQVKRTVKTKFLVADKAGKIVKSAWKPVAAVGGFIGYATIKSFIDSKTGGGGES